MNWIWEAQLFSTSLSLFHLLPFLFFTLKGQSHLPERPGVQADRCPLLIAFPLSVSTAHALSFPREALPTGIRVSGSQIHAELYMHETFILPIGLIHSALDPACFPFRCSPPPPQFCLSGVMLGSAGCPSQRITSHRWVFLFHRGVSIGKETQKPFQRKQPLGTESREMGAKSVQPSFITRLGRFAALPHSVRCLSVPLLFVSISLSFSASPSLSLLSLSADLSRFWTLTYRKGGKEYVREHLLLNEQISALK